MTYPHEIKTLRKSQGLSQKQLGEKVGLERHSIGMIERGLASPSLPTLNRIAEALGCMLIVRFEERDGCLDDEETKCSDHTPYWGVCSTCGQY